MSEAGEKRSEHDLDEGQLKVLEKVEKLMRLAAKNTNAEEAAAATAKAQELLVAYNLDAALVGSAGSSAEARREQTQMRGGMYKYQRDLLHAVAALNFCLCWHMQKAVVDNKIGTSWDGSRYKYKKTYFRWQHVLVGRRLNTRATLAMGEYLMQAIERLVRERYPLNSQRFMREAVAFREGIADELYWRLLERRERLVKEEQERRNRTAQQAGVSTATALSIGTLAQQEEDANYDHVFGDGWSARKRAERVERARLEREAEEAYTRWAEEHPEEAAAEEAKRLKEKRRARRSGGRAQTGQERRQGSAEYWQGRKVGEKIGLDPQTSDRRSETRALG